MKGSTAQVILKNLQGKRLKGILAQLQCEAKGDVLVKLSLYLRDAIELSESDILSHFNFTKGQYYHNLELIGSHLTAYLAGKKEEVQFEQTFQLARELVFAVEYEAALDLIKWGMKAAMQNENFNLLINFLDLVEPMIPQPKIEGMDRMTATELRDNLNGYDSLLTRLEKISKEPNAAHRKQLVKEIQASELLRTAEMALSKRASYMYWKVKETCHTLLREYNHSIPCQEKVLDFIKAYPGFLQDAEYSLAKETSILGVLMRLTKQSERLRQLTTEFDLMKFKSPRAEQERDFFHYPISIAGPLDVGDSIAATSAIRSFLEIFKSRGHSFTPTYATINLYWCLVASFATQDNGLWIACLRLIHSFSKTDFQPKYYSMFRFLEIIHAIDARDWDNALRLIKNLKAGNGPEEFQGMREVLGLLGRLATKCQQDQVETSTLLDPSTKAELAQITQGIDLIDYFDLLAWFEAQEKGCSMMEIVHHRAIYP